MTYLSESHTSSKRQDEFKKTFGNRLIGNIAYRTPASSLKGPAAITKIDNANIRIELLNTPHTIHLQLVDKNMKRLNTNKPPKGERYLTSPSTVGPMIYVVNPNAVYLWESNKPDQKILCDIDTETEAIY